MCDQPWGPDDVRALWFRLRRGILNARGTGLVERRLRCFVRVFLRVIRPRRGQMDSVSSTDFVPVDSHRTWTIIKVCAYGLDGACHGNQLI